MAEEEILVGGRPDPGMLGAVPEPVGLEARDQSLQPGGPLGVVFSGPVGEAGGVPEQGQWRAHSRSLRESAKEKYRLAPRMMWSSTGIPTASPARTS